MLRLTVGFAAVFAITGSAHAEGYIAIASGTISSAAAEQQIGPGAPAFKWKTHGMGPTETKANANAIKRCEHAGATNCVVTAVQRGGCFAAALRNDAAAKGFYVTVSLDATEPAVVHDALRGCSDNGKYSGCTIMKRVCVHDD